MKAQQVTDTSCEDCLCVEVNPEPLRRQHNKNTNLKTRLTSRGREMCTKSRKWNDANNAGFVQSSCRFDSTGAANTDASKGNAAFLSHRRTAATDPLQRQTAGDQTAPQAERTAVCLREVNRYSFTFKPPSAPIYSHFYESLLRP